VNGISLRFLVHLSLSVISFLHFISLADAPENWQVGFQDPATPIMQGIIDLHHDIFFFMLVILVLVIWMLARTLYHESF